MNVTTWTNLLKIIQSNVWNGKILLWKEEFSVIKYVMGHKIGFCSNNDRVL